MKLNKKISLPAIIVFLFLGAIFLAGCDVGGGKNYNTIMNSVQRIIGGNRNAIDKAQETKAVIENINPVFESEEETTLSDPVAKQVNELFKKSLGSIFGDTKLVSIQSEGKTPVIMKYVVKRRINQEDGEALYKNLIESGCREKNGANPSFSSARNIFDFSVYHDFGGRSYILAEALDLGDQSIWVNVY